MDATQSPTTVRRYLLGRQLRELREARGLLAAQAAAHLQMSPAAISRIENGRNAILVKNVRRLGELYKVDGQQLTQLLYLSDDMADAADQYAGFDVPDWFRLFASAESAATAIACYSNENVPGLLQAPGYIRALYQARVPAFDDPEQLENFIQLRLERQQRLATNPPTMHYVISEAVLARQVGGSAVMAEQLRHLHAMTDHDFLTLQVLPFSAGAHPADNGSFYLLWLPGQQPPAFAYTELHTRAIYIDTPDEVQRYHDVHTALTQRALSPAGSRAMLKKLATQHK